MWEIINEWIKPNGQSFELSIVQMILRAAIVFIIAVAIARLASKRFMSRNSAFDLILAIMLGSVLSRAITGQSPFLPALAAGAALVAMHTMFAFLASRIHWFGPLVKGNPELLIEDGKLNRRALKRTMFGEEDLNEALRSHGGCTSVEDVHLAYLERDGNVSVIRNKTSPKVLEVDVKEGVQRISIRLE